LGDSREESVPDSLALKPRVNLHAAKHNYAFFCRQPKDADQLTVMFGEEHCILWPNPAAVAPLGIEVQGSRNVLSRRTSNFDQHSFTGGTGLTRYRRRFAMKGKHLFGITSRGARAIVAHGQPLPI
jgi:hypothetical protein